MKPRIRTITPDAGDMARAAAYREPGLGLPRREWPSEVALFTLDGARLAHNPPFRVGPADSA